MTYQRPEDQEFIWRCKHCRLETHLSGCGGTLLCNCDHPHSDWEFMVVSEGGHLEPHVWHDVANVIPKLHEAMKANSES